MLRSLFEPPETEPGIPASVFTFRLLSYLAHGFGLMALTLAPLGYSAEKPRNLLTEERQHTASKTIRIQPLMQKSPLGDAAITSILSQDSGHLWIAEQSGLHLHDGRNLVSFKTISPADYYAPSLNISSITEDSDGVVWASSASTGITRYNRKERTFETAPDLPHNNVSQIALISTDLLLYIHEGTLKGYRVSARTKVSAIREHADIFGEVSKITLLHDSMAVVSSEQGIFQLDLRNNSTERISPLILYASNDSLEHVNGHIDDIAMERLYDGTAVQIIHPVAHEKSGAFGKSIATTTTAVHGGLFFAGTDSGLYVFHMDGRFIRKYDTHNSGLSNNHITQLYSKEDILWIGTYEGMCHLKISDFETYNYLSDSISNEILNFSQDDSGRIWVGTYDGIFVFDPITLSHERFSDIFPHVPLADNRVMALNVSGSDAFIGTRRSGLLIIDLNSGKTVQHNIVENQHIEVTQILRISDTAVLLSSFNSGVYFLERKARDDIKTYLAKEVTKSPITMLRKNASTVFAANENEIFIYNIDTREFKPINLEFPTQNIQPVITAILALSKDSLLVGTQSHGIFSIGLDDKGQSFFQIKSYFGEVDAYSAAIYSIEKDAKDRLWIATSNGLFLYSSNLRFVRRYSAEDGLQANKFNFGSSFIDKDSFIYFGGSRGYNRFSPHQISAFTKPPSIRFVSVNLSGSEAPLTYWGEALESIILNHNDRFITFEFSALDFTDPESTRYRHKLVGFDTDWIDIGNRGSATYTSLPAGDYVFRVQAVNSAGIWNYDGLSIDLSVEPAPWLTWWAFTAYFVCLVGLIAQSLRFFRNHTLRKHQLQQANETQRAADLFADELQDRIDFQSKLNHSIDFYNKQLLYWARFCLDSTVEYGSEVTEAVHDRILFRQGVLEVVQDSLYYQGERLYANFHDCAARLVNKICLSHPDVCNRLTSVNDVQKELIPAAQALPLAIILAELFDNSLTHAFDAERSACYVRFAVTHTPNPGAGTDTVRMIYQDDGPGIPRGLAFDSPESAGFAIIGRAGEVLGCELAIGEKDRSMVTARFELPWS